MQMGNSILKGVERFQKGDVFLGSGPIALAMHSLQEVIFFLGTFPIQREGSPVAKSILDDSASLAIADRSGGRQVLKVSQSSSLSQ